MRERLRPGQLDALPRREELEALVRYYHHYQNEHKRAQLESGVRRRIEERMVDARERFEQLLAEWVPDEDLRQSWRDHLHHRAPPPPGPPAIRPLVFRGVSDAGSVAEIRGKKGEELEVTVDGAPVGRVAGDAELTSVVPGLRFRLDSTHYEETFGAPADAVEALADFLDDGKPPPWEHASDLLADGLVDTHFALTPRGRRALGSLEA